MRLSARFLGGRGARSFFQEFGDPGSNADHDEDEHFLEGDEEWNEQAPHFRQQTRFERRARNESGQSHCGDFVGCTIEISVPLAVDKVQMREKDVRMRF